MTSSLYEKSEKASKKYDSFSSKQECKGNKLQGEEGAWAMQDAMKALIAKNNALQEQNKLYKDQMERLQRQLDEHYLNEEFKKKEFEEL